MGVLKGSVTVRRYAVEGDVPDDFREVYLEGLQRLAFRDRPGLGPGEDNVGWCQVHNYLDVDFVDLNQWLYSHYVVAALRIERYIIPARVFRAHLDLRLRAWCAENGRNKAPTSIRQEFKDVLELELMAKTRPTVHLHQFAWNTIDRWIAFLHTGEHANDLFRKLFRETFGLVLVPFSPLTWVSAEAGADLECTSHSDFRPRADAIAGIEE